jgi:hypothetical protein
MCKFFVVLMLLAGCEPCRDSARIITGPVSIFDDLGCAPGAHVEATPVAGQPGMILVTCQCFQNNPPNPPN